MADDVENHTIRLLQEMRASMERLEAKVDAGFVAVNDRLDEFDTRLAGQNLFMSIVAGLVAKQDERMDKLEQRLG